MASILALKRRITAAQNVSKTTKAMQMIAASKLKKAQNATLAARPYVTKLTSVTSNISGKLDEEQIIHPYIKPKTLVLKTLAIVLSPDKGLCGGLITNLLREFFTYQTANKNTSYITIGKKVEGQVAHLGSNVIASFPFGNTLPTMDMVYPIIRLIDQYYMSGQVDSVKIITTHFESVFKQAPKITTILPLADMPASKTEENNVSYLVEPSAQEIIAPLLKHYLEMVVFQHLLECFLSEQAARMLAMQNASTNANDIIQELKLEYNKTRQAKITSEILDITGANAKE